MHKMINQITKKICEFYFLPLLLIPLAIFHYRQDYPFFSFEMLAIFSLMVLFSFGLHLLLPRLNLFFQHFLLWSLMMLVISFFPGSWSLLSWMMIGLLIISLQVIFASHMSKIITIMGIAFLVLQFLTPAYQEENIYPSFRRITSNQMSTNLPLRLHVILDEQGSLQDNPLHLNVVHELQQDILRLYQQSAMQVYPSVNSQYSNTINSIPSLLNWQLPTSKAHEHMGYVNLQLKKGEEGGPLNQNKYFDWLMQQGYRIHVYQLAYLDYCAHPGVTSCFTYPARQAKVIHDSSLNQHDKMTLFLMRFLWSSQFWQGLRQEYFTTIYPWQIQHHYAPWSFLLKTANHTSLNALDVIQHIRQDLNQYGHGDAIFIHLLIPHAPYVFNADCQIKPVAQWLDNWDIPPLMNSPSRLMQRQPAYWQQAHCTAKQVVENLIHPVLQQTEDHAEIFIHGDHGTRIVQHSPDIINQKILNQLDLQASFWTVTLVHTHHAMPSTHDFQSLPELIQTWLAISPNPSISRNQIYLVPETPKQSLRATTFSAFEETAH